MRVKQEHDYTLKGDNQQVIELRLLKSEHIICRPESLMYKEQGIVSEALTVEYDNTMERWQYTNVYDEESKLGLRVPYLGQVIPINLKDYNNRIVCRSSAFLCTAKSIAIDLNFSPHYGYGYLEDERYKTEVLTGEGVIFLYSAGDYVRRQLGEDEFIRLDSRYLIAMTEDVAYDIQKLGDIDGQGKELFYTSVSGPGFIWLQSSINDKSM